VFALSRRFTNRTIPHINTAASAAIRTMPDAASNHAGTVISQPLGNLMLTLSKIMTQMSMRTFYAVGAAEGERKGANRVTVNCEHF